MKRGASGLSAIIAVDKPAGCTSHDVVNRVRRIFGERRCGHMGTLDPAATGALAVCVGPATRLDPLLTSHDKAYEFTIAFGSATDTDDAEGQRKFSVVAGHLSRQIRIDGCTRHIYVETPEGIERSAGSV